MKIRNYTSVQDDGFVKYNQNGTVNKVRDGWIDVNPKKYIVKYLKHIGATTISDLKEHLYSHNNMLLNKKRMKKHLDKLESNRVFLRVDDVLVYVKPKARKLVKDKGLRIKRYKYDAYFDIYTPIN